MDTTFSFVDALALLRKNKLVAREGWPPYMRFLYIVPESQFAVNRPPLLGIYPLNTVVKYVEHIDVCYETAGNEVVHAPWQYDEFDTMALDWYEYVVPVAPVRDMVVDPHTGEENPVPRDPARWRTENPVLVWYFNPWTAERRTREDRIRDPYGLAL